MSGKKTQDHSAQEPFETFQDLLSKWRQSDSVGTDDVLAVTLPLIEQVIAIHDRNMVAPLDGIDALNLSMGHLWFANVKALAPRYNRLKLEDKEKGEPDALQITGRFKEQQIDGRSVSFEDVEVAGRGDEEVTRAYYPDYVAYEQKLGHHDALSDVFVLGLILGSLAMRLDLTNEDDLTKFVQQRQDLASWNTRLHLVVAQIIEKMTELDRTKRPQDLRALVQALKNYREQEVDDEKVATLPASALQRGEVRTHIQQHLRDKLFEINRRNRLIYFKETTGSLNLTVSSMPHLLDYKNIKAEQLFFINEELCAALSDEQALPLNKWLRYEDYPYLAPYLDKIRLQANRDAREYGFSQLRLVAAFFRWHDLKNAKNERINSPLILVPATLSKKRGVTDSFQLVTRTKDAQINPALRHHLRALYDIELPEHIDAGDFTAIRALHADLVKQLRRSAKGVELELVEMPRIQLIDRIAKRRLDAFRRKRKRTGSAIRDHEGLAYSYSRKNYEPLGLQIFERDIRIASAPSREMLEDDVKPPTLESMVASAPQAGTASQVEKGFYAIDQGQGGGAHNWEIDLCAATLANFNYRKMTLVRDYNELIELDGRSDENFDTLFSDEARQVFKGLDPVKGRENYNVLPTDPSQEEAVLRARQGNSYVIQGPPGTGKSQTITNLIADYVARGKSVLFVCEKRAALDVVRHRLEQVGLGEISALIHDSQDDKKAFVKELKKIYEGWLEKPPVDRWSTKRQTLNEEIETGIAELAQFSNAMTGQAAGTDERLRDLLEQRIRSNSPTADLDPRMRANLPAFDEFARARPVLHELADALQSAGHSRILARSPVRFLKIEGKNNSEADIYDRLERAIPRSRKALIDAKDVERLARAFLNVERLSWQELKAVIKAARCLEPLAAAGQLHLLDPEDADAQRLAAGFNKLQDLEREVEKQKDRTKGWSVELPLEKITTLLEVAKEKEGSFFAFFSSSWRKAKALVRTDYNGKASTIVRALSPLHKLAQARHVLDREKQALSQDFGIFELDKVKKDLQKIWHDRADLPNIQRDFIYACLQKGEAALTLGSLAKSHITVRRADEELGVMFSNYESVSRGELAQTVADLENQMDLSLDLGDLLRQLDDAGAQISNAVRSLDLTPQELEAAILDTAISRSFARNRPLARFDSEKLETKISALQQASEKRRNLNGGLAVHACQVIFQNDIGRANQPLAGTTQAEKDWCRAFKRGRKLLENEFQKTRAYKSIRELFGGDAGAPLRDLKPVWLMSPLSVADILPLDEDQFDVVIFDEASQIPLEDAVPSLYRAKQFITVGDEMQLPPSQFFSSQKNGDEEGEEENENPLVVYDLNADSFLNRAAGALPRTMLSWHYRSQHESLIGFCSQAFYQGELMTIPSVGELQSRPAIAVAQAEDGAKGANALLERPISYHKLADSPYGSQRNSGEASYIAQMVCAFLKKKKSLSIGIVAFSKAQQGEIEQAIDNLAAKDKAFRALLDIEEDREEDGQFVGLFIKNLENVQGDERDVIILSVCYGPDWKGKMIMNFGPINQTGGEKRLNVIFSRAKKHMAVVASIEAAQITNTWNTGANALRQYLRYAEATSRGDVEGIQGALTEYGTHEPQEELAERGQATADQLAEALRETGLTAVRNYGQSALRCHIALKKQGDKEFKLAILVDDADHYKITNLMERYVTRQQILQAFGWSVLTILAKDWHDNRQAVIDEIVSRL